MEKLKTYPDYKDSGVAWLGKVPSHWELVRFKELLQERKERNNPIKTEQVLSLSAKDGVTLYEEKNKVGNKAKDDFSQYNIAQAGDLLINCMNVIIGSSGITKYYGAISPVYFAVYARDKDVTEIRFIELIFQMQGFQESLLGEGNGILAHRMRISMTKFNNILLPKISINEQQKIVAYLDEKLAKIDEFIKLKTQMIEKLQEYLKAYINTAVTKGINPNAEMKDSGVEWIGQIPKNWEILKLKHCICEPLQYGANEKGIIYKDDLPRYVRITDILNNSLKEDIVKQSLDIEVAKSYILKDKDILFARSGGTVGKTFIFNKKYGTCAFAGYLIKARISEKYDPLFIYYCTQSSYYDLWIENIFSRSTIQNIGADKYRNLDIPSATLQEQEEIVVAIERKKDKVDNEIANLKKEIELMKEYRTKLIADVVTGKVDVR